MTAPVSTTGPRPLAGPSCVASHARPTRLKPPQLAVLLEVTAALAARAAEHDRTATARASGAGGNSTALVGTPDTVAQARLDYVDLGVTTLLIRGYDPLEDAVDYGRELIPLVRAEVGRRDAAQAGAEAELAGRS